MKIETTFYQPVIMKQLRRKYFSLCIIICMLFVPASQNPNLRSSVSSGNYVYVNQTIVIICTTRETHYLAWRSVEYIGRGQQLILNSTLAPGYSIMSIMGAVASVVRVFDGNGDLSLQSRLTFSVTSNFSSSSVACENVDLGTSKSVSWNTRDQPATQLNQTACINQYSKFECLVRDSSTIQWIIGKMANPDDKVNCTTSGTITRNSSQLQAVVTRVRLTFINGTLELVCGIKIRATIRKSVTCLNSEIGVSKTISIQFQDSCGSDPIQTSTNSNTVKSRVTVAESDDNMVMAKDVKDDVIPIPLWLIAILVAIAIVVIIPNLAILAICYIRRARKRRAYNEAVMKLPQEDKENDNSRH